jgi:hypothetical protein
VTAPSSGKAQGKSRQSLILIAVVVVVSAAAVGVYIWRSLRDVDIGVNGYIALSLGVIGTAALGAGLMALLFYSHSHGYDDEAGGTTTPEDEAQD